MSKLKFVVHKYYFMIDEFQVAIDAFTDLVKSGIRANFVFDGEQFIVEYRKPYLDR